MLQAIALRDHVAAFDDAVERLFETFG